MAENIWFVVRPKIASQQVWQLTADLTNFEQMTLQALLDVRDHLINSYQPQILEIDFRPFYKDAPTIDDPRNIGQGVRFLNRYLCDELFTSSQYWLEALFQVLHWHQYNDIPLLINDRITG